jgi:predicted transcriptional regulator with HTH domain
MQNDVKITFSTSYKRVLVIKSLRRRITSKKIAEYLFELGPVGIYTLEIAYNVKTAPTNVIGAIRGMESGNKQEESLISLEIVEQVESRNNVKLYRLTDFGKEIIGNLKN